MNDEETKKVVSKPDVTGSNPNRQGVTVKNPKPFPNTKTNSNNK